MLRLHPPVQFAVPGRRTGALAIAWGTAVANDVVADPQLTLSGPTALKVWPGHLQNLELPRPRRKSSSSSKGIGDDEVWVNTSSLDHPLVILPDQAIEIVAIEKKVMVGRTARSAYWLNHDPSGLTEIDKVTVSHRNATCDGRGCDGVTNG